jgi:hypothetical protein
MNTTENKHQTMEAIWNDCYQNTNTLRQCYEMAMDRWAEQSRQPAVSGWLAFQDIQPLAMQEIYVYSKDYGFVVPEYRRLTEEQLKEDWSSFYWMPVTRPACH